MTKKKLAFSLIELAVVVLIIGLLTAAIMKGTSIIRSSRIATARSITAKSRINEINGMVAWYEASMIDSLLSNQTSDASQISEWRDINSNSFVSQKNKATRISSNAVTYKIEGINNIPSLQFLSSGSLSLAAFYQGAIAQPTVFAVIRPTISPTNSVMNFIDSAPASLTASSVGITNSKVFMDSGTQAGTLAISNQPSFSVNSNYIIAAYFNDTNSKVFVNDSVAMAGGGVISIGSNQMNGLTIGSGKSGTNAFTGLISEIIIFDHQLQIEERKSVMNYLSKKYKIKVAGL